MVCDTSSRKPACLFVETIFSSEVTEGVFNGPRDRSNDTLSACSAIIKLWVS